MYPVSPRPRVLRVGFGVNERATDSFLDLENDIPLAIFGIAQGKG